MRLHHVNVIVRPGETERVIEFYTDVAPDAGLPPIRARWSQPRDGVVIVGDTAIIRATITRHRFRS